ncbi:MAG: PqqD family protein [Bacteroidales bacterium]|jgi:methyltransferase-like protein|nr:PqqD family protein [Bacteroidales bacterium]
MADLKSVPSRSPSIVTRKTGNEYVLVPVANNIADMDSVYTLNETGAFIWELIDGKKNVNDIIEAVVNEYETDNNTATTDVFSFIDEMSRYLIVRE